MSMFCEYCGRPLIPNENGDFYCQHCVHVQVVFECVGGD